MRTGGIQPVRTILNQPQPPNEGALGEVSVPYTDAYVEPDVAASSSTVCITRRSTGWQAPWTQRMEVSGTVCWTTNSSSITMSLPNTSACSGEELTPLSPHVPSEDKRRGSPERAAAAGIRERTGGLRRVSTGGRRLSGTYTTPVGNFITYHKRPTRHMANGDIASNGFDFPGVPWVLYITEAASPSTAPTGTTTMASPQPRLHQHDAAGRQMALPLDNAHRPPGEVSYLWI